MCPAHSTHKRPVSAWPSHGGQAQALLERFGLPPGHMLEDFSANLNPLGPPAWAPSWLTGGIGGLSRYPEPNYFPARQAIAAYHGLSSDHVLLTNGGSEAIFLAAALHAGSRSLGLSPSFGEYARACQAHRLRFSEVALAEPHFTFELAAFLQKIAAADVIFLCRPNNPTATLISYGDIEELLVATQKQGVRVVVDEAFIDMAPNATSLTPLLTSYPHLILLRSMTKFYTLPGVRLGYILAAPELVEQLAIHQPPWSVNHLAAELIAPLINDHAFADKTQQWLTDEQPRMQQALLALPLDVVPSHTCFFLVRPEEALRQRGLTSALLFERLLHQGMLARHTYSFTGLEGRWLRLALRDPSANDRLLKVLNACLC